MGVQGNWKEEGYSIKIGEPLDHRGGTEYVVDVFDKFGNEAAYFKFDHLLDHSVHGTIIHVQEAEVLTPHRRKGIATAVYSMMEADLGVKIHRESDQQSEMAKKFWNQNKFGK